jgi:hypothetical protein
MILGSTYSGMKPISKSVLQAMQVGAGVDAGAAMLVSSHAAAILPQRPYREGPPDSRRVRLVNSPILFGRAPYDWRKDFSFITTILTQPMALVVHPSVPANTRRCSG